jgi:hypothetical protein
MRIWYDTEFNEDGRQIILLSIGLVGEDGRKLYLENRDADRDEVNDWVKANVVPNLHACLTNGGACQDNCPLRTPAQIREELLAFCDPQKYGKPEFWGYYSAYDHVALCQLFGAMINLPRGWPMYTNDLKQWCDQLGNPRLPAQESGQHHALADAEWNRRAWEFLNGLASSRVTP